MRTLVADGLPQPLRIATKLGVHFSESLQQYKDNMGIQKNFQLLYSELPANQYVQFSLDGPYWPCYLANNSATGKWKFFLILIFSLYD